MGITSWLNNLKKSLPFIKKKTKSNPIDLIEHSSEENSPWWGHFLIKAEQSRYYKIGDIILCIDHYNQEWKLAIRHNHPAHSHHSLDIGKNEKPIKVLGTFFAEDEIKLKPILADRNLEAKLNCPLYIPAGTSINLFASSPSWVQIEIGQPPSLLEEIPTKTLADTWHGKNTLSGDLCYAGEESASPRLEDLLQDNTNVITPILIQNFSKEGVYLKKIILPLPFLCIYSDAKNQLWTEKILLTYENDLLPRTTVTQGYPKNLENPSQLAFARIPIKTTFKNLFGAGRNL